MWTNETNQIPYVYCIIFSYCLPLDLSKLARNQARANQIVFKWRLGSKICFEKIDCKEAVLHPPQIKDKISSTQRKRQYEALRQLVDLFGGTEALAQFLKISGSTVRMWLSGKNKKIPYELCIILCDIANLSLWTLAPDERYANAILEPQRLQCPVSAIEISLSYLRNRTLSYLNHLMSQRVIVDGQYRVITGLMQLQSSQRAGQKHVLVIALDLKALLLGTRTLDDFSSFFSMDECFAIAMCLLEQWDAHHQEALLELASNPTVAQRAFSIDLLDENSRDKKIAQIVGMSSKKKLYQGLSIYKNGIFDLKLALNQGKISLLKAYQCSKLSHQEQLESLQGFIKKGAHCAS